MTSGISVIDGSIQAKHVGAKLLSFWEQMGQAAALAVADVSGSIAAIAAPTGSRLVAGPRPSPALDKKRRKGADSEYLWQLRRCPFAASWQHNSRSGCAGAVRASCSESALSLESW